ncbi:ferredoxin [Lentibacter algarum]|nr:ferredoxin [Lentibacter algarum]
MVALHQALSPAPEQHALAVYGALHDGEETVVLLGPEEGCFWPAFTHTSEYGDGLPNPLDRFSKRIISDFAESWGGIAVFPSDGPPYPPFMQWAMASGQAWQSPIGMLVHARAGLWASYRGAVRLPALYDLPEAGQNPCDTCADKPCLTACPVGALNASQSYDVPACKAHIGSPEGADCLKSGCLSRRACPQSQAFGRAPEQSNFHMKAFL